MRASNEAPPRGATNTDTRANPAPGDDPMRKAALITPGLVAFAIDAATVLMIFLLAWGVK